MASGLFEMAQTVLGTNGVMAGRTKVKIEELIKKYPDGICLSSIAFNTYNGSTYPVFTFAEEPDKYFSGGTDFMRLANGLVEMNDGDLEVVNDKLRVMYLKIRIEKIRTSNGRPFVKVIPVGNVPAEKIDAETGEVLNPEELFGEDAPF